MKVGQALLGLCALSMAAAAGYIVGTNSPENPAPRATTGDNAELQRIHDEDQSDRNPTPGQTEDWAVIQPRDRARLQRVKALFSSNQIRTANDYYHAAMVLQHGEAPEDYLLAHEFCVVAITKGKNDKETRWLAASAEDRFLVNVGRPQRFATQFHSVGGAPMKLYDVDESVTDELRRLMDANSLEEARARDAELNRGVSPSVYSKSDTGVEAPVEIQRQLPRWPPMPSNESERSGRIEVVINEKGAVESATVKDSTIEAYDHAILSAVGNWQFKPAMRNGQPVKYRHSLEVVVPQ